jgi:ferritin-like metal-binding protein YciE
MAELNERDIKLAQYLNEAYGKEKELETALEAHIGITDRAAYKKRLQAHLRETKDHARRLERRIKQLGVSAGGLAQPAQAVVSKAASAVKGPVHALRGTGAEERQLKNAKTELSQEAEEIATYTAIEAFADGVGDKETAKLAREIRRDEERMAKYLLGLIPQLAGAVVRSEVPTDQRPTGRRRSSSRRTSSTSRRSGGRSSGSRRSTASGSRRSTASARRATSTRGRSTRSRSRARTGARS